MNHHFDDESPFRRLTITMTNHHSDDLPSRRITISKINHYDDWAFQQRISIWTNDHLPTKSTFDDDSPLQWTNMRRQTMFRRRNIFEPVAAS